MKRALTTLGLLGALTLASAQTTANPSFEANSFKVWLGYISSNSPEISNLAEVSVILRQVSPSPNQSQ